MKSSPCRTSDRDPKMSSSSNASSATLASTPTSASPADATSTRRAVSFVGKSNNNSNNSCSSGGDEGSRASNASSKSGFTIVELLVVLGIVVILASIFIPYLLSIRERSNRTRCANNLRQIRDALVAYASNNDQNFPRVVYDEQDNPNGYVAFSGPDDPDPFAPDSAVLPNDVSASLWLLVRRGLITNPSVFTCPSSSDW